MEPLLRSTPNPAKLEKKKQISQFNFHKLKYEQYLESKAHDTLESEMNEVDEAMKSLKWRRVRCIKYNYALEEIV